MKSRAFTEKRKIDLAVTENKESGLTMKKRRKHRAGKYFINNEVNVEDSEDFIITVIEAGETILDVQCGTNTAKLTLEKLWQGSKGQCINFQGSWLTPNEFQYVSGRETAKDWKRSIRHQGKSIKLLLSKGYIKVTTEGLASDESARTEKKVPNPKQRGKRGRRKGKLTNKKVPVLVNNTCHLNANTNNNAQTDDSKENNSESTDDSNDGNETDDTIENYYPLSDYSGAKENLLQDEKACYKQDKAAENVVANENDNNIKGGDQNKKEEKENEGEEDEDKFETTEEPETVRVKNSKPDASNGAVSIQEVDSESKIDGNKEIHTEENEAGMFRAYNKDTNSDVVKSENEEDDTFDSVSVDGCGITHSCSNDDMKKYRKINPISDCPKTKNKTDETETTSQLIPTGKTTSTSIDDPSLDEDNSKVTCDDTPRLKLAETEVVSSVSDDVPPTLSPQIDLRKSFNESGNQNENDNDAVTFQTRSILSLPLKKVRDSPPSKSDVSDALVSPPSAIETTKSCIKTHNMREDSRFSKASDLTDIMTNNGTKIRNNRKRTQKQAEMNDSSNDNIIPIKKGPNYLNNESIIESSTKRQQISVKSEIIDSIGEKRVSRNDDQDGRRKPVISTEHGSPKSDKNKIMKEHCNNQRNFDHPLKETFQKYDKRKMKDLELKISNNDDTKPLINLSTTVPKRDGINREKTYLQTTYDEYMRRLEASHMASVSWNPFFPYFQYPGHLNGVNPAFSPFTSPYPPLLTPNIHSSDHALSPKTKVASPLLSPYTATSPPSFEISKIPVSVSAGSRSLKDPEILSQKPLNLQCSPTLSAPCLTIKPAHSVQPNSICSSIKAHGVEDFGAPLDLTIKKRKYDDVTEKRFFTDNNTDFREKKHRKLKHLWINKTDYETQTASQGICTCKGKKITDWSVDQVTRFVHQLDGCGPYAQLFSENKISGTTLHLLTTDQLTRGLGMKVGPAIVLSDAIDREKQNSRRRTMSCSSCSLLRVNANVCF